MTVTLDGNTVVLSGSCGVEEVETLVEYLTSQPDLSVNLEAANAIHTALWQTLMIYRPPIFGSATSSLVPEPVLAGLLTFYKSREE